MIAKLHFSRTTLLYASAFTLLLVIGISATFFHYITKLEEKVEGRIYPNVFIDNISVGQMKPQEARDHLLDGGYDTSNIALELAHANDTIATFSAKKLELAYNLEASLDRAYLVGRMGKPTTKWYQKLSAHFGWNTHQFSTQIEYNTRVLSEFLETYKEQHSTSPKDALFAFEDGRVTSFQKEENGKEVQIDHVSIALEEALSDQKNQPKLVRIALQDKISEPKIALKDSNDFGIEELIGYGQSDYSHSITERIHNVILATNKFNGVLVPPGEDISFGEIIGDISASTGFKSAYVIKNGKTVLGDGGGVCQVSTTLFRAALNTGLPIVERHPHSYRVGYYENDAEPGFDATIYTPTVDLRIKNDTKSHILVQTTIDEQNSKVNFYFYGKKDGRKSELSPVTLYDVAPPGPPIYEDDPTLAKGVTRQVDFAAWGGKSTFDYKVTYPDGETKEETFNSNYRPWQAVFLRGTKE